MDAKQLEDALTAIANKAQSLRDAGVVGRVSIGDVSFEVASAEPSAPVVVEHDEPSNPVDDPETYGGYIPRRRAPAAPVDAQFDDDKE